MNLNIIEELKLEQGTPEWHAARAGWVTASELSSLMAKGEGKTRAKYMRQLAAEQLLGRSAASFTGNVYTEMGKEYEPKARQLLCEELGVEISETGVVRNHEVGMSCSPDGLIGTDEMAEFKCCIPTVQIERLEKGTLPTEYAMQVQGSLLVTGRKACWFQSYSPDLPRLVVRVEPDYAKHAEIRAAVTLFRTELAELVKSIRSKY
ncbi:YqaJ viral recombinase family protein [Sinorhizobium medicae]|uniref:lambda exonuclease family protein n=1 Tax=Sinorhizobium medicae TaxID=110321 RepID=UPI002AF6B37F|nr:YqaJ viral recombinase family protein [Sinorhizobium medicae]WQO60051.1 YqaJ viral recombinase family protein [Sinorhizobium medicae]